MKHAGTAVPDAYRVGWARDVRHAYGALRRRRWRAAWSKIRRHFRSWRLTLPWQAETGISECSCSAARGLTRSAASRRVLDRHNAAVNARRCAAAEPEHRPVPVTYQAVGPLADLLPAVTDTQCAACGVLWPCPFAEARP